MELYDAPISFTQQITVTETVTCDGCGTDWLPLREGGRYFDISIEGEWRGTVTLEMRSPGDVLVPPKALERFDANLRKLFKNRIDADVRLWVRRGDLAAGEMYLEIGN